jgi:4-hydroxybenzoyl-CoA reductase subunit beta
MMRLPRFEYISPGTVKEICGLLKRYCSEARILAGGTDLLVACKLRIESPAYLIGLKKIEELKGIRLVKREGLKIGAMTSLSEIRDNPIVIKHYTALSQAARSVGAPQIQEMGTIGGNLCLNTRCIYYNQSDTWRKVRERCLKMGGKVCHVIPKGKKCCAVFSGDMAPSLLALGAKVKLVRGLGERLIPVENLYSGDSKEPISLKVGEFLSEIILPPPVEKQSSIYLKYRLRGGIDFPLAGVAVRVDSNEKGNCTDCKVVLTGVGSLPVVVPGVGESLEGKSLNEEMISQTSQMAVESAHPVPNASGSTPTYRRRMVGILTKRALFCLAKDLGMIH